MSIIRKMTQEQKHNFHRRASLDSYRVGVATLTGMFFWSDWHEERFSKVWVYGVSALDDVFWDSVSQTAFGGLIKTAKLAYW